MKSITIAATAAFSLIATAAVAEVPWQTDWSAPQAISPTPLSGTSPENGALAASADALNAVAIWAQIESGAMFRVWVANTKNAGASWSTPTPLSSNIANAEFPDIAMSDDGARATAVWYVSVPSGYALRSASTDDGGDTWTTATIAGPIEASRNPHIAGSADGTRLVATWAEYDGSDDLIYAAYSSDAGDTWSSPAQLSSSTGDDPAIAMSADGLKVLAAFTDYDGSHVRAAVRTSSDGGVTWNPIVTLSEAGQGANQPQIGLSEDGTRATCVWSRSDGTRDRVQVRSTADAGATWTPAVDLSDPGADGRDPRLATAADGTRMTVAWQRDDGSERRIQSSSSSDAGSTWTAPVSHSADDSTGDNPQVAVSADGSSTAVTWYRLIDFNPSRVEVATSADSGKNWAGPVALSDTAFDSRDPYIALSTDGRRIVTTWAGVADDPFIRASTGILRTVPDAPSAPAATAGDAQVTASWTGPTDDGGSPITGYTATASPGGQTCTSAATSCTIGGLANGTPYTVTVTAANAIGTGPASAASTAVTPSAPPAPPTPPAPTPEPEPDKTKVKAKAVKDDSKLKVTIKPDLGKKKQWEFVIKVKKKGDWKTIKTKKDKTKVYETEGSDHALTVNLDEGKYKAKSKEARGHLADTSDVVKLKK